MKSLLLKILLILILLIAAFLIFSYKTNMGRGLWFPIVARIFRYSVQDRLNQYGSSARSRFMSEFEKHNLGYPALKLWFVAIKEDQVLEVWAANSDGVKKLVKKYPFTDFSGGPGPKLREGDRQIPEGFYKIEGLNPNSSYHLSMKVNYPNEFDWEMARVDGRTSPGSLIFIHGKDVTIGCIPVGDPAIEELFVMAAEVGKENIEVIISPLDFRREFERMKLPSKPAWVSGLYERLEKRLKAEFIP